MPAQKRSRPAPGSASREAPQPKGTAFRKSAKKQRTDDQQDTASSKPKPKPKPQPQRQRPKDQPKPKTKHEFIKAKQEAARREKEAAQAAADKEKLQRQRDKAKVKAANKANNAGPAKLVIVPPAPTRSFHLIAGSYERILYGLQATLEPTSDAAADASASASSSSSSGGFTAQLKPVFTFPAHVSSIRTVATADSTSKWLATGGTDEVVKVWDLRRRREVGQLTGHEGTITSLTFASKTYLLTTSADSNINLYRTSDWALLRTLKGHIGRINSAAPHPSGRLALSVGSDRTIRMWDLMRGRAAASTKIGIEADLVRWDTKGRRFAVLAYRQAMVFSTDMTKIAEVEDSKRIGDIQFARVRVGASKEEHELLFAALEDGTVKIYDLDAKVAVDEAAKEAEGGKKEEKKKKEARQEDDAGESGDESDDDEEEQEDLTPLVDVGRLVGHKNRVKAVSILPVVVPSDASGKGKGKAEASVPASTWVASTISSDGFIRVFDLTAVCAALSPASAGAKTLDAYAEGLVSVEAIGSYNTKGTRLTCLSTVGIPQSTAKANGDDGDGDEDEDEDEDDGAGAVVIESDEDAVDVDGMDEDESDGDEGEVDEAAEDAELKRLEKALKEAQAKGLKLEDLEELLEAAEAQGSDFDLDDDEEYDAGDSDDDEEVDEVEDEVEGPDEGEEE
ncbi:uncharacterized protein PFL1_00883 [Pseudozyma flocculosa PF-1]|uniref:Related to MAK11 protein (Maintenance of killer toxin-encoding satellite M1 dsRNA) n=1 Tax=Pseudozyma flocculosa TaxID=84751 RepID=A0A5C3F5H4_9BASI|nr:uncharacterized protein PFL1_00883 [Pseudozyma flocculosa PF-1]EPQ31550.1 hypothetical protein PFL1_00883 [Pseudozyma flocculosa PF-1]SPO38659.1 related to MAK11 protein (maintenance of killer toxin-encoding satellite M1 dsRNA) [Pseudozyma flocculosa]